MRIGDPAQADNIPPWKQMQHMWQTKVNFFNINIKKKKAKIQLKIRQRTK
jgi:hypothetical protein